jgi:hypothetical protein
LRGEKKMGFMASTRALRVVWKGILLSAYLVLAFQIGTTGWWFQSQVSLKSFWTYLIGCGVGFIIACLEYAMVEALRIRWERKEVMTFGRGILLGGVIVLCIAVCAVDVVTTTRGVMVLGISKTIALIWGLGQLFAFEFLHNMGFHLKELAENDNS